MRPSQCQFIYDAAHAFGAWLHGWQTLIAGTLALVGAILTVRKIRQQLDQTERHERERRHRKCLAKRILMANALTNIINYINKAISLTVRKLNGEEIIYKDLGEYHNDIILIAEYIDHSNNNITIKICKNVIKQINIFKNRLKIDYKYSSAIIEYYYTIITGRYIVSLCTLLYSYTIFEKENIKYRIHRDTFISSFRSDLFYKNWLNMNEEFFNIVVESFCPASKDSSQWGLLQPDGI